VRGAFDVSADAEARTLELVASTEIVVIVLDGSRPLDGAGRAALELSRARTRVIVLQKSDLPRALHFAPEREGEPGPGAAAIPGSARTGEGLAEIRAALASAVAARELAGDAGFGPNARQRACLGRARAALDAALAGVAADRPAEVVAIDLRAALDALGEVTGASCPEDLLDRIFARFCIGK
jgi:tRNA modification GTPase